MKTSIILVGMLFLVGCGDATYTAAQDQASDDPTPSQSAEPSQDDAGPTLAQVATPDAGQDSDPNSVDSGTEADAGQVAPKDWTTCCSDCSTDFILCQRNGSPDHQPCDQDFGQCMTTCGTAPAGQTCNP